MKTMPWGCFTIYIWQQSKQKQTLHQFPALQSCLIKEKTPGIGSSEIRVAHISSGLWRLNVLISRCYGYNTYESFSWKNALMNGLNVSDTSYSLQRHWLTQQLRTQGFNSLGSGKYECSFRLVNFKLILTKMVAVSLVKLSRRVSDRISVIAPGRKLLSEPMLT